MSKQLPQLKSIVTLIETAALYPAGALREENYQSYPVPTRGPDGLRVAFLYCIAAIEEPRQGLRISAPKYVAFLQPETGMFEELRVASPADFGLAAVEDRWLGTYLTLAERQAPEFLTKLARLYQDYDLLMAAFAASLPAVPPETRKAAAEFSSLFPAVVEKALLPYYQVLGKHFFAWLRGVT